MEDQYFIPTLEQLFIGYEFEYQGNPYNKMDKSNDWKKAKIGVTQEGDLILPITRIPSMLKKGWIRTPYLTHEILEINGWKTIKHSEKFFNSRYSKGIYELNIFLDYPNVSTSITKGTYDSVLFLGVIKSINELRKIEQYLKIT